MTSFLYDDDEVVDAELVEDEPDNLPAVLPKIALATRDTTPVASVDPTVVAIPMTFAQRMLVREALSTHHRKGPRERSTAAILKMIEHMADYEPVADCSQCDNTGRVRSMYEVTYCACSHGLKARTDGHDNSDVYKNV